LIIHHRSHPLIDTDSLGADLWLGGGRLLLAAS